MEQFLPQLKQLSSKLLERLDSCEYDELEAYMTERNALFDQLMHNNKTDSTANAQLSEQIKQQLELDKRIVARMTEVRTRIGANLNRIHTNKKGRASYDNDNAYSDESFFFDTKR